MTTHTPSAGQFTGKHMLAVILGFFGVVIAVNVTMAVISSVSWTGLVVDNSYVASQEFEKKRLAHLAQVQAGWLATFTYLPGVARLIVVDGAGNDIDLGDVTLKINRPVGGHDDKLVTLSRDALGGYSAEVQLDPGVWQARLIAPQTPKGWFEQYERFNVEPVAP
ncbi:MAG: FixH family protein [Devosia sp.]